MFKNLFLFLPKYSSGSVKHLSLVVFRQWLLASSPSPALQSGASVRQAGQFCSSPGTDFWDFPSLPFCAESLLSLFSAFSFLGLSLHFTESPFRWGDGTFASLRVGVRQKAGGNEVFPILLSSSIDQWDCLLQSQLRSRVCGKHRLWGQTGWTGCQHAMSCGMTSDELPRPFRSLVSSSQAPFRAVVRIKEKLELSKVIGTK